jgi:uncharacterized protein
LNYCELKRALQTGFIMKKFQCIGWAVALIAGVGSMAQAASYDCNKARLASEKTVCANRDLNDRDVKMATTFNIISHAIPMGGRDHLIAEQVIWLKQRNGCGSSVSCIANAYQNRQKQLDQMLQDRVFSHGPF